MRRLKGVDGNIFANEDIFEEIINNSRFGKFVGDCITHYLYTKTVRMQDYQTGPYFFRISNTSLIESGLLDMIKEVILC